MSEQEKCPKCGAEPAKVVSMTGFYECGRSIENGNWYLNGHEDNCLRRQLATAQAIVARLPRWSQLASLGQYGLLDAELYEAAENARKGVWHGGR